jgi:Tfp pilus assembly protein PilE
MRRTVTHRQGLTLVELILALFIIEVALLIMVQTVVRGAQLQQRVASETRAALVAQAQMDAVLRYASAHGVAVPDTVKFPEEPQPVNAAVLGIDESAVEGYRWQVTVRPHGNDPKLREMVLHLIWTERARDRQFELVSLCALPQ